MSSCHDMKKGEVYVCQGCGLELQVMEECKNAKQPHDACTCHPHGDECVIDCCGEPLVKKD